MEQPISHSPGSDRSWLFRTSGRIAAAVVTAAVAYVMTIGLPDELNLLIPYDIGVVVYLALFYLLMGRTSPERAAGWARRGEPNNALTLIIDNVRAVASN
jgi:uncharacterized membrane protein